MVSSFDTRVGLETADSGYTITALKFITCTARPRACSRSRRKKRARILLAGQNLEIQAANHSRLVAISKYASSSFIIFALNFEIYSSARDREQALSSLTLS